MPDYAPPRLLAYRAQARKRQAAEKRARQELVEYLTAEQRAQLKAEAAFDVPGARGDRWRVILTTTFVQHITPRGEPRGMYGIYPMVTHSPPGCYPPSDAALAVKLLIETDEALFLRTACGGPG